MSTQKGGQGFISGKTPPQPVARLSARSQQVASICTDQEKLRRPSGLRHGQEIERHADDLPGLAAIGPQVGEQITSADPGSFLSGRGERGMLRSRLDLGSLELG